MNALIPPAGEFPARRLVNFAGFAACAAMLGFALYAQRGLGLEPCPLCMFQRVGVGLLGAVFLAAALHDPRGRVGPKVYALLLGLAALVPGYVAGRHVYIQSLPEGSVPACGATLDYMMEVFPLLTVIRKVLTGGGECAKIDWTLLGLSMPAWVLLAVISLTAAGIVNQLRRG